MAEAALRSETVRCLLFDPHRKEARMGDRDAPPGDGDVPVEPLAVGLDATDTAVAKGEGTPPLGMADLVLGHEALLRVAEDAGPFRAGDRVVPLVRRGCGRCAPCRGQRSDLCATGDYTEHGIKGLDGWLADRARARADELVAVPAELGLEAVLTEPLSISVKALEHARAVHRARLGEDWPEGERALVVGLGSLGSLAALLLRDHGFEVDVVDRTPEDASRRFCARLGCRLTRDPPRDLAGPDGYGLVVETPGSGQAIADALEALGKNGVLVTLGTPGGARPAELPLGRMVRELVLENQSVLGSVNANHGHFEGALRTLARWRRRDPGALALLLEATWPPARADEALRADAPLKKVVRWPAAGDGPPRGA